MDNELLLMKQCNGGLNSTLEKFAKAKLYLNSLILHDLTNKRIMAFCNARDHRRKREDNNAVDHIHVNKHGKVSPYFFKIQDSYEKIFGKK